MLETTRRLPVRTHRIVCAVAGGLILLAVLLAVGIAVYVKCSSSPFTPPDTSQWQTGDVFFSAGNSWRSMVVRLFGGESEKRSTHCGFVLRIDGEPMLVHMSTEKGMITMESIGEYARINNVSAVTARRLPEPIDTLHLRADLTELIARGKRFDDSFNHRDTTEYYCTEMVVNEMMRLGCPLFNDLTSEDYIYPRDVERRMREIE